MTALRKANADRRQFERLHVRCPARIRIGKRQYAGYLDNISDGGARFTTLSPIRGSGPVCIIVADLPPLKGHIRWSKGNGAGVSFALKLDGGLLRTWIAQRPSPVRLV